jgi:hypothetical protein
VRTIGVEPDGDFGATTRAALKARSGFDVDRISWAPQDGITVWIDQDDGEQCVWPPIEG